MKLEEHLNSARFLAFQDEDLRETAIQFVENIFPRLEAIKRSQLHSISAVIQAGGLKKLRKLTAKQKDKNSNKKNKAFWSELDLFLSPASSSKISLFGAIRAYLLSKNFIRDDEVIEDVKAKKDLRKRNKVVIEMVMERILPTFFEHFTCHYFYKTQQGAHL